MIDLIVTMQKETHTRTGEIAAESFPMRLTEIDVQYFGYTVGQAFTIEAPAVTGSSEPFPNTAFRVISIERAMEYTV